MVLIPPPKLKWVWAALTQPEIQQIVQQIFDSGMFAVVTDLSGDSHVVCVFASLPAHVSIGMLDSVEQSIDRRGGCAKTANGQVTSFPCINHRHPDGGENVFLGIVFPYKDWPCGPKQHIHVDPAAQSVQTTDLVKPQGSIPEELYDDLVGSPFPAPKCECGAAFTNQTHQPYCPVYKS